MPKNSLVKILFNIQTHFTIVWITSIEVTVDQFLCVKCSPIFWFCSWDRKPDKQKTQKKLLNRDFSSGQSYIHQNYQLAFFKQRLYCQLFVEGAHFKRDSAFYSHSKPGRLKVQLLLTFLALRIAFYPKSRSVEFIWCTYDLFFLCHLRGKTSQLLFINCLQHICYTHSVHFNFLKGFFRVRFVTGILTVGKIQVFFRKTHQFFQKTHKTLWDILLLQSHSMANLLWFDDRKISRS